MDKNKKVNPEERDESPETRGANPQARKDKQSLKEGAINKQATDGKEINPQIQERREKHQPRDGF